MKREQVQLLEHGLYKIFWKEGGMSVASVGSLQDGQRWMAPSNWINVPTSGRTYWKKVKKAVKIETDNL